MPELPYKQSIIKAYFDKHTYARGLNYFHKRHVKNFTLQADQRSINRFILSGQVKGSHGNFYKVSVISDAKEIIDTECSCYVGFDCKHAVALLLQALAGSTHSSEESNLKKTPQLLYSTEFSQVNEKEELDYFTSQWLNTVTKVAQLPVDPYAYAADIQERLLYILKNNVQNNAKITQLTVEFYKCRKTKSGGYGNAKPLTSTILHSTARYLTPADQTILQELAFIKSTAYYTPQGIVLKGEKGVQVLEMLLQTGRCHWDTPDNPPLKKSTPKNAHLEWIMQNDGDQRLIGVFDHAHYITLTLTPPWYIDCNTWETGLVLTGLSATLAQQLLSAPAIKLHEFAKVKTALDKVTTVKIPLPVMYRKKIITQIKPVPCLRLYAQVFKHEGGWYRASTSMLEAVPYADLSFDYQGTNAFFGNKMPLTQIENKTIHQITRNTQQENKAASLLQSYGLKQLKYFNPTSAAYIFTFHPHQNSQEWVDFTLKVLPVLQAKGWHIEITADFPHRYIKAEDETWYSELGEPSDNQWFELELGIMAEGERINLLPILQKMIMQLPQQFSAENISALAQEGSIVAPLQDGRKLILPLSRIKPILYLLTELFDPAVDLGTGKLKLSVLRAAQLEELAAVAGEAAKFRWFGSERLLEFSKKLRHFKSITAVEPPTGFQASLRFYQQQGLNWLQFLREYNLAGILADDMGLGKTVQALAHILLEKQKGRLIKPALVIAPTSLMFNWAREAERFAPALRVLILQGADRKQHFDKVANYDLLLTTYPLVVRDHEFLMKQDYYLLVLDEAQVIKNPKAKVTQLVQLLKATHRFCLTGTPMENHLGELWSLFNFLLPGLLGDARQFHRLFRTPIEKHADAERRASLARRIAPFLLRRTKEEVVKELPKKIEMIREIELEGAQRDLYESVRLAMHEKITAAIRSKGLAKSHIIILDALLKLRQICCDPRLLKMNTVKKLKTQSAKLTLLMEMLSGLLEEGRQILLFSQFTEMLGLIEHELKERGIQYVKLTGQTVDRHTPIQLFQTSKIKLFLISLKAGGVGLNLTAADTVIHYDPWWNPAVEQQATDRAHRIGQNKTVFVYKLITRETVEQKILDMQTRKRALLEGLLGEPHTNKGSVSGEDLLALFSDL